VKQEATTADARALWLGDGEHQGHGDERVGGRTTGVENLDARATGVGIGRADPLSRGARERHLAQTRRGLGRDGLLVERRYAVGAREELETEEGEE